MLKNYLITAYRNLVRNRNYTIINIAGLTTGIAVCLLIFVVIQFEQSYDTFHHKKDRIYRILTINGDNTAAGVPAPLPTALEQEYPGIESSGVLMLEDLTVLVQDKNGRNHGKFREKNATFLVAPAFFDIFDYPWLIGKPSTAMKDHNSAVLSQSTATRYFGDWKKAMGQTLNFDGHHLMTVTGIVADPPLNTDIHFNILAPYTFSELYKNTDWLSINSTHGAYVLLPENLSEQSFNRELLAFSKRHRAPDNKAFNTLQSLSKVHFDTHSSNFSFRIIAPERIQALWLIAFFILLIACVNFINLSTAQAVNRAKEIGVRKALGSGRHQLRTQFLAETFLLVLGSMALALPITLLLIEPAGAILGVKLSPHLLYSPQVALFVMLTLPLITLLAGFYPAIVLSGFNPLMALKGRFIMQRAQGFSLRKSLVVVQFVIAQALIIGTLLIIRQMDYFTKTSMGFVSTAIIEARFPHDSAGKSRIDYLRNQLLAQKDVQQVSFNNDAPASADNWWTPIAFDHGKPSDFVVLSKWADADYLPTYQLPLVAGRNITRSDSVREFLVNEAMVKKLGFQRPEDVLNKHFDVWGVFTGPVVGVVKDFHEESMKSAINPSFIGNVKDMYTTVGIKINGRNAPEAINNIRALWEHTFPDYVFEYKFTDDRIADFYKDERQLSALYKMFAVIAIFLSCLGLYGLASFMAVQRVKEVGIRKVLGATAANILYLFSKEFIVLIGIAFLLATPLAWYFINQWLQNYVYHITISWWIFVLGGAGALVIALATISFQAMKAVAVNPAKSLKGE
jgi:putative ABC transport system permease protein